MTVTVTVAEEESPFASPSAGGGVSNSSNGVWCSAAQLAAVELRLHQLVTWFAASSCAV
jgi:hypothetical protein